MIAVLDSSAAIGIVLRHEKAAKLRMTLEKAEWVIAPQLFICEVANTFWKYHALQHAPLAECETAMAQALALPDDFIDGKELHQEAFGLACLARKPVYDMFFLALARRHNAVLVSMDNVLRELARKYSVKTV